MHVPAQDRPLQSVYNLRELTSKEPYQLHFIGMIRRCYVVLSMTVLKFSLLLIYPQRKIGVIRLISEQRVRLHRVVDFLPDAFYGLGILGVGQHLIDEVGHEVHHVFLGAACGHGCGTEAYA